MGNIAPARPTRVTLRDIEQLIKHNVVEEVFNSELDPLTCETVAAHTRGRTNLLYVLLAGEQVFGGFFSRSLDVARVNLFELAEDKALVTFHSSADNSRLVATHLLSISLSPRTRMFSVSLGDTTIQFSVGAFDVISGVQIVESTTHTETNIHFIIFECN